MFDAFRYRDFRLFWIAELISRIGFWLQTVGQSWLVWHLSGSALAVAMVIAAQLIPSLLLAPLGGLLADRLPRRNLLLTTQLLLMLPPLALWRLASVPHPDIWAIAATASAGGLLSAVDTPTRLALIPGLVPREVMPRAVAVDATSVNLARMLGPALAAVVIAVAGMSACFLLNALSYLAVIAILPGLRVVVSPVAGSTRTPWFEGLKEGLRFASEARVVRGALLVLAVYAVLTMNSSTLLPAFADGTLRTGSAGLGLLLAAQGSGALIGTFASRRRPVAASFWQLVLAPAVITSIALIAFAAARWMALALPVIALSGLAQSQLIVGVQRLLQAAAPERLRGRVMALFSQVMLGGLPLGALVAGSLARVAGIPVTIGGEAAAAALLAGVLVVRIQKQQEVARHVTVG